MNTLKLIIQRELHEFLGSKFHENSICRAIINEQNAPIDRYRRRDGGKHFTTNINYLGFSIDQPNFISYMSKDRIKVIRKRLEDFNANCGTPNSIYTIDNILPLNDHTLYWDKDARYHGKGAKVVRKLFTAKGLQQFKDKDFEQFSNLFKSFSDSVYGNYSFKVVTGDEIAHYYNDDQYSRKHGQNGSLWGSCMKDSPSNYFDIYTKNPDQVSMLIMLDEDEQVLGRALIWKDISFDGVRHDFMDRIYYVRDSDCELFKDYARKNDMVFKARQSYDHKNGFIIDGNEIGCDIKIELGKYDFSYYPYVDTFTFMTGDVLSNDEYECEWKLESTGGQRDEGEYSTSVWDEYNQEHIQEDDAVYCQYGGGFCHQDSAVHLEYLCESAFPNLTEWSHREERDLLNEDAVEISGGGYVHNDNAYHCDITDEYYHEDDCIYSEYHETSIPINDMIELSNGEYVMKDSEDEAKEHYGLIEVEEAA